MAIASTVTVTFTDGVTRVVLETEPNAYATNDFPVQVFPKNPDVIRASVGTLTQQMNRTKTITGEVLLFNSEQSAQLKYPAATAVVFTDISALIDADGNLISSSTFAYNPTADAVFALDADGNRLSVTGGVRVDYQAEYSRYLYSPQVTTTTASQTVRYGSIVAIKNGVAGKLDFTPEQGNRRNYTELYRVYSEVVVDPDGRWEKPPDFPDDNSYPSIGNAGPDTSSYVVDQRVHEYGFIYRDGFTRTARPHIRFEQPYIGNANYSPVFAFRQATAPAGYEDAFRRVQWGPIYAELEARYSGLDI